MNQTGPVIQSSSIEDIEAESASEPQPLIDRLYAVVFRASVWPMMNVATGRSIHRKMRFLEQSQWWSRDQLEAYQLAKLQRLIRHVYEKVPFYRRAMRARDIHPEDFRSPDALRYMPVVTKAMLQENPRDFLADGSRLEDLIAGATSGSTGRPTRFYHSREQDSWHWALKYRMWGMAGYRVGLPCVAVYNVRRHGLRRRLQDLLLRNRAFYAFESGDRSRFLGRLSDALCEKSVRFAAGSTSTLQLLAEHRRAHPGPPLGLSALLTTGSVLTSQTRSVLTRYLGAPVWDHYGLGGEGVHVAAECERHDGYHVNLETLVLESLEASAGPADAVPLLVTALDNYAWPLIRYESGDAAVFSARRCPCGRGLPLLQRIEGRVGDVIVLAGAVRLNAHYFADLAHFAAIRQYQVVQTAPDRLVLRIVWDAGRPCPNVKFAILARFRRITDGAATLVLEDVADIATPANGKHRYVIALPRTAAVDPAPA